MKKLYWKLIITFSTIIIVACLINIILYISKNPIRIERNIEFTSIIQAFATIALVLVTYVYVRQNRIQMEFIQREDDPKYILENIYAEVEQNLGYHRTITDLAFRFSGATSFEDLPEKIKEKSDLAQKLVTVPFESTIWDRLRSNLKTHKKLKDLDKFIVKDVEKILELFGYDSKNNKRKPDYPFYIKKYEITSPPEDEKFYNRLLGTYSRIQIQNELAYVLRVANSSYAKDFKAKVSNYFDPLNFKALLHDLVRSKSYLQQALDFYNKQSKTNNSLVLFLMIFFLTF